MEPRNEPQRYRTCEEPECSAKIRDHYDDRTSEVGKQWFFHKDRRAWCPEHQPEWVPQWRADRARVTDVEEYL